MSRFQSALHLVTLPGVAWKDRPLMLTAELVYRTDELIDRTHITVPNGYRTDFASIPRFFWRVIGSPVTGKYREAAVVHDWLCSVEPHLCCHHLAADVFKEAMLDLGVSPRKAALMAWAVRWFGPKFKQGEMDPPDQPSLTLCPA